MPTIVVNGEQRAFDADPDTPLLWVLRDKLGLVGTKFGCGTGACGACTVHLDGAAVPSCITPVSTVLERAVTTIEGLSDTQTHPLQQAWIAEQVPQCGYCQSGQLMAAAGLLKATPQPSSEEIEAAMSPIICRCGTYDRIGRAIRRAVRLDGDATSDPRDTGDLS